MSQAASTRLGVHAASPVLGLLMVGAIDAHGPALMVELLAVAGVAAATVFRPAATLAVLLVVVAIVISGPPGPAAALSGLCAAAYLVLRHDAVSWPTVIAALGFSCAGVVAASFPLRLPWWPLLAPLLVFASYLLVTRPFFSGRQ